MLHAKRLEAIEAAPCFCKESVGHTCFRCMVLDHIDGERKKREAAEARVAELEMQRDIAQCCWSCRRVRPGEDPVCDPKRNTARRGNVCEEHESINDIRQARVTELEARIAGLADRIERDRALAMKHGTGAGAAVVYFADRLMDRLSTPAEVVRVVVEHDHAMPFSVDGKAYDPRLEFVAGDVLYLVKGGGP